MEVILLEKIVTLGELGDKVVVKSGYGRNYLIPHGKALLATKDNVVKFAERRQEILAAADSVLRIAIEKAKALRSIEITLTAKAGDEGKLFGSIGVRDLANAITDAGVKVARSDIMLSDKIRTLGEYDVKIKLHPDVVEQIKIFVVSES